MNEQVRKKGKYTEEEGKKIHAIFYGSESKESKEDESAKGFDEKLAGCLF